MQLRTKSSLTNSEIFIDGHQACKIEIQEPQAAARACGSVYIKRCADPAQDRIRMEKQNNGIKDI